MKLYQKVLSSLLAACTIMSNCPFKALALGDSSVEGRIVSESGLPIEGVDVEIHSSTLTSADGDFNFYTNTYYTTVTTDSTGIYKFDRPSENCLIKVDLSTLPEKQGADIQEMFLFENEIPELITVSAIDDIVVGESNNVNILNSEGQRIFAEYSVDTVASSNVSNLKTSKMTDISNLSYTTTIECNGITEVIKKTDDISSYSGLDKAYYLYEAGLITEEEKIDAILTALQSDDSGDIECPTSIIEELFNYYIENQTSRLGKEINTEMGFASLARSISKPKYHSYSEEGTKKSGLYTLHYEADESSDAYVDATTVNNYLSYINNASGFFLNMYQFHQPEFEAGESTYHIYLADEFTGHESWAGYTQPLTTGSYICIKLKSDVDAIKRTIAHELFHTIQYEYNNHKSLGNWFAEASSTWAGYFYVNKYMNSAKSHATKYLSSTDRRLSDISGDDNLREYGMFLFPQYICQNYGGAVAIRRIFNAIESGDNLYAALEAADSTNTATYEELFLNFQMYTADTRKYNNYCNSTGTARYPNATQKTLDGNEEVLSTAAVHYGFNATTTSSKIAFSINTTSNSDNVRYAVVYFPGDNSASKTKIFPANASITATLSNFTNTASASKIKAATLIACNTSTSATTSAEYSASVTIT